MRDLGSGSAVLADADRKPCGEDVFGCVQSLSWVVPQSGHVHALTLRPGMPFGPVFAPQWEQVCVLG